MRVGVRAWGGGVEGVRREGKGERREGGGRGSAFAVGWWRTGLSERLKLHEVLDQ